MFLFESVLWAVSGRAAPDLGWARFDGAGQFIYLHSLDVAFAETRAKAPSRAGGRALPGGALRLVPGRTTGSLVRAS